jgi:hypothetical protein
METFDFTLQSKKNCLYCSRNTFNKAHIHIKVLPPLKDKLEGNVEFEIEGIIFCCHNHQKFAEKYVFIIDKISDIYDIIS